MNQSDYQPESVGGREREQVLKMVSSSLLDAEPVVRMINANHCQVIQLQSRGFEARGPVAQH